MLSSSPDFGTWVWGLGDMAWHSSSSQRSPMGLRSMFFAGQSGPKLRTMFLNGPGSVIARVVEAGNGSLLKLPLQSWKHTTH